MMSSCSRSGSLIRLSWRSSSSSVTPINLGPKAYLCPHPRQTSLSIPHTSLQILPQVKSFSCLSPNRSYCSSSTSQTNKSAEQQENNKSGEGAEEGAESAVSEQEQKLAAEIEELKAKNADLMDKYRRSLAESDNMRKRLTKQVEDAKVFGIQGFVKDLLEVSDVLNKAVNGVPEDALANESQYLRDMHQGLQLTESQLLQVYKRHGLEQENPLGQKFDPNKHEALFQIPAPDKDPNTVLDVQKVGYLLHGRTVRPALVGVSKK